jgi:hypothetical protein
VRTARQATESETTTLRGRRWKGRGLVNAQRVTMLLPGTLYWRGVTCSLPSIACWRWIGKRTSTVSRSMINLRKGCLIIVRSACTTKKVSSTGPWQEQRVNNRSGRYEKGDTRWTVVALCMKNKEVRLHALTVRAKPLFQQNFEAYS